MLRINGGRFAGITASKPPVGTGHRASGLKGGLMILFGPFMGFFFICLVPLLPLIAIFMLLPRMAWAGGALDSDEAKMCMGCHSIPGMVKTLKNSEKLSVHLQGKDFAGSVHGFLSCTNCHTDISMDKHPSAQYESKADFARKVSASCRMCHPDGQILANTVHKYAIHKANAPPCSGCHGDHAIKKLSVVKAESDDSRYCLSCHSKNLSITLDGKDVSLSIDSAKIENSVHAKHKCLDCHVTYSKEEHPIGQFKTRRELSIALSEACRGCHAQKYAQIQGSIHYAMLKGGNLEAPVCSDCHGGHSVGKKALAETMSGTPCRTCHGDIFDIYKESVHGRAKSGGKHNVPLCSSCHFAHDVKAASSADLLKKACLGCHDALEAHAKWLPNAEAHLDAISCAACHVPGEARSIHLVISESATGKAAGGEQLAGLLGADNALLKECEQSGDCIDDVELWKIYWALNKQDAKFVIAGRMKLNDGKKAHHLQLKAQAVRECERCHRADSDFFADVKMAVVKPNGKTELYNMDPKVLQSAISILPLSQFYALGSTRVKLLDILGVLFVLGGMSFPALHITVRMLTRGIRQRNKGVKK